MAGAVIEAVKDPDVKTLCADVMERFHGDLSIVEVTVGLEWAWPREGDDSGDAVLLWHKYPVAVVPRVTPHRQRIHGVPDVVLTFDGRHWRGLDAAQRLALMDHGLSYFEPLRDDQGAFKSDDGGRPKVGLRLYDWAVAGFGDVLRRHGRNSLEYQVFSRDVRVHGQVWFSFMDDADMTRSGLAAELTVGVGSVREALTEAAESVGSGAANGS